MFVKNPKRASAATAVKLPDFQHPQKAIADGLKTITIYGINEKTKCSYKSNKTFVAFRGIWKSTYVCLITYGKFLLPRRTAWCKSIYILIRHSISGTPKFMTISENVFFSFRHNYSLQNWGHKCTIFFIPHNCVLWCERKGVLPIKTIIQNTN